MKNLLTPYMSLSLKALTELFESYRDGKDDSKELWSCAVKLVHQSFINDEGGMVYSARKLPRINDWCQFSGKTTSYARLPSLLLIRFPSALRKRFLPQKISCLYASFLSSILRMMTTYWSQLTTTFSCTQDQRTVGYDYLPPHVLLVYGRTMLRS